MQFQGINRNNAEKVMINVVNGDSVALEPGRVVEWTLGTSGTQAAGVAVRLVDVAVNLTTGIGAKVAGVVPVSGTIAVGGAGQIQIAGYHPAVRSAASIAQGRMVVASSVNATNIGVVDVASQAAAVTSPEYTGAVVGWTVENSASATTAKVHIGLLG